MFEANREQRASPAPEVRHARPETRGARLGLVETNTRTETRVGRDWASTNREAMLTY